MRFAEVELAEREIGVGNILGLGPVGDDAQVNIALTTSEGRTLNVLSRFEELRRG